jgi:hypothetical protein
VYAVASVLGKVHAITSNGTEHVSASAIALSKELLKRLSKECDGNTVTSLELAVVARDSILPYLQEADAKKANDSIELLSKRIAENEDILNHTPPAFLTGVYLREEPEIRPQAPTIRHSWTKSAKR